MRRMMIVGVALVLALTGILNASAMKNKGAEQITLDGGSRGVVPFPHHRHQTELSDCMVCHDLFPQERGSILRLKKEGQLVTKQVMNKHCIKCHKRTKKAGDKSGPTTCSKCHVRS